MSLAAILLLAAAPSTALPTMSRAANGCPVQNANLVDPVLFVTNETHCEALCASNEACLFYYYYQAEENVIDATDQPSQCFLYDGCTRRVFPATTNCPLKK